MASDKGLLRGKTEKKNQLSRKGNQDMPLSETLSEGLDTYSVGQKIRLLRDQKKMGLVELGKHTGLSAALLSKIERGKMYPTLPTLLRIAMVFNVGLDHFFDVDRRVFEVVRSKDRKKFPESPRQKNVSFHFESLDFPVTERKMNAYLAEFQPSSIDDIKLHRHSGVEFIYVLEGKLGIYARDKETQLAPNDSIYFDSGQQHGYRRVGRKICRALVVVLPG